MSKMDRAYEVKQYEQSIENGNTPEISKEDHDDFRNTIKKRYYHAKIRASFLNPGMKIIAHSNDEYKTMQNGYRDIDLQITKNEEIDGSTIMTTATNIDDETDIYYFATTRLTDGTQTTRNITTGDDTDPLTQVQFRQLGVRA